MNVKLLRQIQDWLREEEPAEKLDMSSYGHKNACGTTCCIAGKALLLSGYKLTKGGFMGPDGAILQAFIGDTARKVLGLTLDQQARLFHIPFWPEQFQAWLGVSRETAIKRIDHFIETGGRE